MLCAQVALVTALLDASDASSPTVWQLGFWPPDRDVRAVARKPRARIVIVAPEHVTDHAYACTYPGCARGPENPFEEEKSLASHRFAAHGIRSTNAESVARQQRRDKIRARKRGAPPPEYIDPETIRVQIAALFPINLGPNTRAGELDLGDREHVRRRLCYLITQELKREIRRSPAEICVTIAQLAAGALAPLGISAKQINPDDALLAGPRPQFSTPKRGKR